MTDREACLKLATLPIEIQVLDISAKPHPTKPHLVNLSYRPESPRFDPYVRQARGLVVDVRNQTVVSKPMPRFFNVHESPDPFDYTRFTGAIKRDGSLVVASWHDGEWLVSTSGGWGDRCVGKSNKTYEQWFRELKPRQLDTHLTYCFELCVPANKIVTQYRYPSLFTLAAFDPKTCEEISLNNPAYAYIFRSLDDANLYLQDMLCSRPTLEGMVLKSGSHRVKLKTPLYRRLHKLWANGTIHEPKVIAQYIAEDHYDDLMTYFPEVNADHIKRQIEDVELEVLAIKDQYQHLDDRQYADVAKKHPFTYLLFAARKGKLNHNMICETLF